jgi:hypothetical protein
VRANFFSAATALSALLTRVDFLATTPALRPAHFGRPAARLVELTLAFILGIKSTFIKN